VPERGLPQTLWVQPTSGLCLQLKTVPDIQDCSGMAATTPTMVREKEREKERERRERYREKDRDRETET